MSCSGPSTRIVALCSGSPSSDGVIPAWTYFGVMPFACGQCFAQRLHRVVVVEAVERDEVLKLRAQGEIQPGEIAHRRRRQAVQLERPFGLRMRPDPSRRSSRCARCVMFSKNVRIEPRDVVLVLVGHDQQIEALLPAASVWQHRLEIADRSRQVPDRADRCRSRSGCGSRRSACRPFALSGCGNRGSRRPRRCRRGLGAYLPCAASIDVVLVIGDPEMRR